MLGSIVLSAILMLIFLNKVFSDGTGIRIPTKEEQVNILKNVEELFNEIDILVTEEGVATDAAVTKDTQTTVDKGLEYLSTIEDYAMLKLSCLSPAADCDKVRKEIEGVTRKSKQNLHYCVNEASASVHKNTQIVTNATDHAMARRKHLIEILINCSEKPVLQQISCYRKAIKFDAFPLKSIILNVIKIHKSGHIESIAIRSKALECVDETLTNCHNKISEILSNATDMCT